MVWALKEGRGIDYTPFLIFLPSFVKEQLAKHCWKERLKISKLTKITGYTPKARICCKKSPNFKEICMLYGGGTNLLPTKQTPVKFGDLAELYLC